MPPEVLVLGGGPAGCAAARLLSLWGHDVTVITRPLSKAGLAESVPPSCGKLFEVLGVRAAVEAAGFVRSSGNTVWWGDGDMRVEPFPSGEHGWQIIAAALEAIMREAATAAGARLEIRKLAVDDVHTTPATFVLDCSGRSGLVARSRGWRVHEDGHRTVALVGRWRANGPWTIPDATHTLVESYGDGWAWSVPDAAEDHFVAVMVDPRASNLAKDEPARAVYLSEIAKTRRFAAMLDDRSLVEGPSGWDASMYTSSRFVDERTMLVGDAGSFIDPLSSAGVQKALASGWLAAIAVHTALVRPSMRATAFDFFEIREREMYGALRGQTAKFLADAAKGHPRPFWIGRATALDTSVGDDLRAETLGDDPDVRAAFARLREAPSLSLQRGTGIRVESRAAVSGCEIVLESRLVTAERPEGLRFLRDVDLLALVDLAPTVQQVPDLFEVYQRRQGPVALPDFLAALSVALAKGWLVWSGDRQRAD